MFNSKNSRQQGTVGLGAAIAYFTSQNLLVSIPLNDSQEYDLVVDDGISLKKVQVKTTSHKTPHGVYSVLLQTCGGNQSWQGVVKHFDSSKVDWLFVLCDNGDSYCIPCSEIDCKTTINMGKKYELYKTGGVPSGRL